MDKPRVLAAIPQEQLRLKGRIARYEAGIKKMKGMRVPYTAQPRHLEDLALMEKALDLLKDEYEAKFGKKSEESSTEQASPGRQLPGAYSDRGHQFDQVALQCVEVEGLELLAVVEVLAHGTG